MRKRFQAAVLAGLFSTLLACSVERTPNGPSALSPIGSLIVSGSGDPHQTSWACATRTAAAEPSVTTGEWSIQPQNCFTGTPAILSQSAPMAGGEPIFAPGPTNFRSTVNGSTVLLQWDQSAGASGWQIEAGSSAGLANLAVLRLGPVANFPGGTMSYTVTGVPNGVYFVRVRSTRVDFSDVSVPSNEIIVAVGTGCTSAPNAPASFSSSVIGNTVNLQWAPPTSGPPPTSYLLEVGSAAGLSDILVFDTGNAGTSLQAFAPSRTYFVRLRSRNACGTGANAAAIVVVVGGTTPVSTTTSIPVGPSPTTTTTTIPVGPSPTTTTTTVPGQPTSTTTTTVSQPTTTSTTVPTTTTTSTPTTSTSTSSTSTSTTSSSTSSTTTTSVPVAPTATFTYSPNPCTLSTPAAVQNCTFSASANPGSGTSITAYLWTYLNVTDAQTSNATYTPNLGGCGLTDGAEVNFPVTLKVRNNANVVSQPYSIPGGVTLKKVTGACGFGNSSNRVATGTRANKLSLARSMP